VLYHLRESTFDAIQEIAPTLNHAANAALNANAQAQAHRMGHKIIIQATKLIPRTMVQSHSSLESCQSSRHLFPLIS
jgi:hypothetical protein